MPTGGAGAGFRLSVPDNARDNQVGIVEGRAVGVEQRVPQLAAFVNGARRFRRDMARNTVGPGELPKEPLDTVSVLPDRRVDLAVRAFQIGMRHDPRTTVTGADDVDHVEIVLDDQPVQVGVDEIEPRGRPPMPEQARLDVVDGKGPVQKRIVFEVDLADGEVVRRAPIGIHLLDERGIKRAHFHVLHSLLVPTRFSTARTLCPLLGPYMR